MPVAFRSLRVVLTVVSLALVGCAAASRSSPAGLWGTAWRLEDLGGAAVPAGTRVTLEFPEDGKVAGRGSCNQFFGTVEISGETIRFGPLGSTKMACGNAVDQQEAKYLKALQAAERFTVDGRSLRIYSSGMDKPLRFAASSSERSR